MRRLRRSVTSEKKKVDTPRASNSNNNNNNASGSSSVASVRRVFRRRASSTPLSTGWSGSSRGSTRSIASAAALKTKKPTLLRLATDDSPLEDAASMASTLPECDDDVEEEDESLDKSKSILFVDGEEEEDPSLSASNAALVAVKRTTSQSLSRTSLSPHFIGAVGQWCHAVRELVQSPQMRHVLVTTHHLLSTAGGLALHTALLPVTLPIAVTRKGTRLVWTLTEEFLEGAGRLLLLSNQNHESKQQPLLLGSSNRSEPRNNEERKLQQQQQEASSKGGIGPLDLVIGVWRLPGQMLGLAGSLTCMVKDEIGSTVTQLVAPSLALDTKERREEARRMTTPQKYPSSSSSSTTSTVSSKASSTLSSSTREEHEVDFLARLRLDFSDVDDITPSKTTTPGMATKAHGHPTPAATKSVSTSRMLLRVDDLGLLERDDDSEALFCIDLTGKDPSCSKLFAAALDRLAQEGLSLFSNHHTARLSKPMEHMHGIVWKPEGSTGKLLRKLAKLNTIQRLEALKTDTLIWSGKMGQPQSCSNHRYQQVPFFLSRGIVQMSPRAFLHLLWDNKRTSEYNNYCLGRHDILVLDGNNVLEKGARTGTKVIESETRIPITGSSILMSCLMHVRPLEAPDQGYVIVSRSLDEGAAGDQHISSNKNNRSNHKKSEILWGINVLRQVPNRSDLTDLTSLSQVSSSMVPKFMQTRLGIMGIEDFYRNVRQNKSCQQQPQQEPQDDKEQRSVVGCPAAPGSSSSVAQWELPVR